ncbi:hypothetical protein RJ640_013711 [Escallonia rubra]|uniref:Uncharacterized protein n=1 Tax=Escallonia rubra TaxID=112253 RepID=A0AA88QQW5_9ASTE|nr:hypothetical protein RJ640_013711 [Escallonia rubra]
MPPTPPSLPTPPTPAPSAPPIETTSFLPSLSPLLEIITAPPSPSPSMPPTPTFPPTPPTHVHYPPPINGVEKAAVAPSPCLGMSNVRELDLLTLLFALCVFVLRLVAVCYETPGEESMHSDVETGGQSF